MKQFVRAVRFSLLCLGLLACSTTPVDSPKPFPAPSDPAEPAPPTDPTNPTDPSVPGADNALLHRGSQYAVNNGLIRIGRKEGNHVPTRLDIADGVFLPRTIYYGDIPVTVYEPVSGVAEMEFRLYSAGEDFAAGTYSFLPPPEEGSIIPNPQGQHYIERGTVHLDLNGSGDVTNEEKRDITGGSVTVKNREGGMSLVFDLVLEDGTQVVGSYNKTFYDPRNAEELYPGPGAPPPPQDSDICTYLIQGKVEEPTVLKDTPAACDYLIDNMIVDSELSVEPGVVIRAVQKGVLYVTEGEGPYKGKLTAIGTPDKRIVFEGAESLKGHWQGVEFKNAQASQLHYVDIRDTGYDCRRCNRAGLTVENTPLSLENSTLSNGYRAGLYLNDKSSLTSFSSNRFSGHIGAGVNLESAEALTQLDANSDYLGEQPNGLPYIQIVDGTLTENETRRWKALNVPYAFERSVDVQMGSLSLDPGVNVIVKGKDFKVGPDAQLDAQGSAAAPVSFRAEQDENNAWSGIYLLGSQNSTLQHVRLSNAEWGVYLENEAALSISDSFIEAEYGIFCDTGSSQQVKNKLILGENLRFETREFDVDSECVLVP